MKEKGMKKLEFTRRFLLNLYLSISVCIVFLLILIFAHNVMKSAIAKNIEANTKKIAISTIYRIDSTLSVSQQMPEVLSYALDYGQFTEHGIKELLKSVVKNNSKIYGSTISFEPYMFEKGRYFFGPYFFKPDGEIKYSELGGEKYNYFKSGWYTSPKKLNKGVWSEPYFDEGGEDVPVVTSSQQETVLNFKSTGGGKIRMITYSHPFYKSINGERLFSGVVTCDIALSWLQKLVTDVDFFGAGYAFILSPSGNYIIHKNENYVLNENIFSLADKRKDSTLRELGKKMTSGQSGFAKYYSYTLGKSCLIYYAPLNTADWSLGVVVPEEELLADSNKNGLKLFIIWLAGCVLIIALIIVFRKQISSP